MRAFNSVIFAPFIIFKNSYVVVTKVCLKLAFSCLLMSL